MLMEDIQIEVYRSTLKIPAIFFVPAISLLSIYVISYLLLNSNFFVEQLEVQLNSQLPGQFSIKKVMTDSSLTNFRLIDASIRSEDGKAIIDSGNLSIAYNPALLLAKKLQINAIHIEGARVHIALEEDGVNLLKALGAYKTEPSSSKSMFQPHIELKNISIEDSYFSFEMEHLRFTIDDIDLPDATITLNKSLDVVVPFLAVDKIPFYFEHEMFHLDESWGDWEPLADTVSLKNWHWRGEGFVAEELDFFFDGTRMTASGTMDFPETEREEDSFIYTGKANLSAPFWSRASQYFVKDLAHFDAKSIQLEVAGNLDKVDLIASYKLNQLDTYGLQFFDLEGRFELNNQFILMGPAHARVSSGRAEIESAYFDMYTGVFGALGSLTEVDPFSAVSAFGFDFPWLEGRASGTFQAVGQIPYEEKITKDLPLLAGVDDAIHPLVSITLMSDAKFKRQSHETLPGTTFRIKKGAKIWSQIDRVGVPEAVVFSELGKFSFKDFVLHFDRWMIERTLDNHRTKALVESDDFGKLAAFYGGTGMGGSLKLEIDANGKMNYPNAEFLLDMDSPFISFRGMKWGGEHLKLKGKLSDGVLGIKSLTLTGDKGNANLSGSLKVLRNPAGIIDPKKGRETTEYLYPRENQMDLEIDLSSLDLYFVSSAFSFGGLTGSLDAKGNIKGTLQNPEGELDLAGNEVVIMGQKIRNLKTNLILEKDRGYGLRDVKVDLGPAGLIVGDVFSKKERLKYDLKGRKLQLAQIQILQTLGVKTSGKGEFHLYGEGTLENPSPAGYIRIDDVNVLDRRIGDLALVINTINDVTHLSGALLPWVTVDAEIPTDDSAYYARLGVNGVDITEAIGELQELNVIQGSRATGIVELFMERDFSRYQILANLSEFEIAAFGKTFHNGGNIIAGLNESRLLQIQQGRIGVADKYVDFSGGVFLDQSLIDLEVSGEMDLSLLTGIRMAFPAYIPEIFLEAEGTATTNLSVKGPPDAISLEGDIRFGESEILLRGFSEPVTILGGKLDLNRNEIRVDPQLPIKGRILGGLFSLTGSLGLESMIPVEFRANLRAQNLSYRVPEIADLTFGTDLSIRIQDFENPETWKLSGEMTILDGLYYQDFSVLQDALTTRLLGTFTQSTERYDSSVLERFPQLGEMKWDLKLTARDGVRIRNEIDRLGLDLELRMDLRLRNTLLEPDLRGEVDLIGGTVAFQGEQFKIRNGTLNFTGNPRNPRVDVIAEADIQNACRGPETNNQGRTMSLSGVEDDGEQQTYRVILNVSGKLDNMNIQFESNPFADQRDILSLLLTGCTVDQLTASSAGSPTLEVALGPVLGWIEGQVQDAVKVEEFTITPSFDRLKATVGDSITRRLSWRFQLDTGLTDSAGGQLGQLVYKLSDQWSAQLSESASDNARSDESSFLIEVKLKYRLLID